VTSQRPPCGLWRGRARGWWRGGCGSRGHPEARGTRATGGSMDERWGG
jgi:hypothetical protein